MDRGTRRRARARREVVLLVDDRAHTRVTSARLLRREYDVIEAESPHAAVQIIAAARETGDPIDLILLDGDDRAAHVARARIGTAAPELAARVHLVKAAPRDDMRDLVRALAARTG